MIEASQELNGRLNENQGINAELNMEYIVVNNHALLENLDYESANHTGFQQELVAGNNITIENNVISSTTEPYNLPVASDIILGGIKIGENLTIDQNGKLNAQQGVETDNLTINLNAEEEIQTIGIIDSKTTNANKFWTGTINEYNAIEIKDDNTFYNITDDDLNNGIPFGGTTNQVLTKSSNQDLDVIWDTPVEYRDNVEVITDTNLSYTIDNLTSNKSYKLGLITSLTISEVSDFDEESVIYFSSGTTATVVTVPTTLVNIGDIPTFTGGIGSCETSKSYIIAILNNIAIWKAY